MRKNIFILFLLIITCHVAFSMDERNTTRKLNRTERKRDFNLSNNLNDEKLYDQEVVNSSDEEQPTCCTGESGGQDGNFNCCNSFSSFLKDLLKCFPIFKY